MADTETGGAWSPQRGLEPIVFWSGLSYSNRSNSLLTDLQEKHIHILLDEKALTFSKLLQKDFNTRKLARDEGDQNLWRRDYLRGQKHVAHWVNMTGVMKTNDTIHRPWLHRRGVWFISRAGGDTVDTLCIFVSLNLLAITVPPVSLLCCIGVDLRTVFGPSCDRDHLSWEGFFIGNKVINSLVRGSQ